MDFWIYYGGSTVTSDRALKLVNKYLVRKSYPSQGSDPGNDPWWFDDYCWWGLASLKAARAEGRFSADFRALFRGITDLCYQPVYRFAPTVYANAIWFNWKGSPTDLSKLPASFVDFSQYAPLYEGGVWNWLYLNQHFEGLEYSESVPGNVRDSLHPIQNTVTNALTWVLSERLYNDTGTGVYGEQADKLSGFFSAWFDPDEGTTPLLDRWKTDGSSKALVRERVAVYKNGSGVPGYLGDDFFWGGDQGLVLGAVVARLERGDLEPSQAAALHDLAEELILGVTEKLRGDKGQLLPWSPFTHPSDHKSSHGAPSGDFDSYSTGIGVFMRYLLAAYRSNTTLRAFIGERPEVRGLVVSNGTYVLENPAPQRPQGRLMLNLVNDLVSLTMAAEMSR